MSETSREPFGRPPSENRPVAGDLEFVSVELQDQAAGGWYRMLDATQIEVLSRAQLERVPLNDPDKAEEVAREKIVEIISQHCPQVHQEN